MKIILDKQTLLILTIGLTLLFLLLSCIILIKINNEKDVIITTYKQTTTKYSQHCDITFKEFIKLEKQKLIEQQLLQQNQKNLIIFNKS